MASYCNIIPGIVSNPEKTVKVAAWKVLDAHNEFSYIGMFCNKVLDETKIDTFAPITEVGTIIKQGDRSIILTEYELAFKKSFESVSVGHMGLKKLKPVEVSADFE